MGPVVAIGGTVAGAHGAARGGGPLGLLPLAPLLDLDQLGQGRGLRGRGGDALLQLLVADQPMRAPAVAIVDSRPPR
ncbi:hypothetical protein AB0J28_39365 [Streptosporangium canum]|uniref:hypothetical protein n=1 Tax=Streptosporangium canum TaxID=324952 RepID=UPI003420DCEC